MIGEISNELPISMAIFMELFCSIHMSVFVLLPLAAYRNPEAKMSTFCRYFIIRAVILFFGNFINTFIAILDFLCIFFMAFIILPVMKGLKEEKKNRDTKAKCKTNLTYEVKNNEISKKQNIEYTLQEIGILDSNLFMEELYKIFINYKVYYSNRNAEMLTVLCDEKFLHSINKKIKFLEAKGYKEISESFSLNGMKINKVETDEKSQKVFITIDVSLVEYLINDNWEIVRGDKNRLNRKIFNILLSRTLTKESESGKCLNCGAPVVPYDLTCDYCTSTIENKGDWRISSIEERIYEMS